MKRKKLKPQKRRAGQNNVVRFMKKPTMTPRMLSNGSGGAGDGLSLNGVEKMDGRRKEARRWNTLYSEIAAAVAEVNGIDPEDLGELQRQFIKRTTTTALMLEIYESRLTKGEAIDSERYGRLSNTLGRFVQALGIDLTDLPTSNTFRQNRSFTTRKKRVRLGPSPETELEKLIAANDEEDDEEEI